MRVVFVLPNFSRKLSGGKKVIFEYSNYLDSHNNKVSIFYPFSLYAGFLKKVRIPVFLQYFVFCLAVILLKNNWFKLNRGVKVRAIYDIKDRYFKNEDKIIATAVQTAGPVAALKISADKYYFIQDYENWEFSDEFVCNTYSLGMTNIVISDWLKKIVDKYSRKESIKVVDGIDTNIFKVTKAIGQREEHTIVFQYRSAKHKGAEFAFKAISSLQNKYSDLKVYCISREERPNNLPSSCIYLRNLTSMDVARVNNKARIFLCSTVDEGFGLPGLEAMACGCAVVSTEYRGAKEYAINGYNSLLSHVNDYKELADNIETLFHNKELESILSNNGVKTASEKSIQYSAELFEEVLKTR
ncbi:glycosyltransferase family 4 protein [Bifidobacterium avesanii]|uniref:Glycosyltransferase n=1 Tax=Bifidobacterium avesanii TaxID=1798157 RepID=A0A7K3TKK9_9BIFI|nr:glycosyltransferase family 4 protein [Bifidobacterium avesanii]KAB8287935.1 glycosyl transferase family 1 [Bifidobacterium avesanii]NEG79204.1 glycosyltransferase [Bifidobacterium avesanii]